MKRIKKILAGVGVFALGAGVLAGVGTMSVKAEAQDVIADGIYIGKVDVSGMTQEQAKDEIDAYVDSMMDTTFSLTGAAGQMSATAKEMGVAADADAAVEEAYAVGRYGDLITRYKERTDLKKENKVLDMGLSVDKQATAQLIYDHSDELNVEAVDNSFRIENGNFVFIPGQKGNEVDIVESVYAINDFLEDEWDGKTNSIELVTRDIEPRGSEEELSKLTDVLGTFSTDFSSSAAGRAQNVRNACSKINGTILYPGEEFSAYETISPFTEENGYGIAGAYENGQVVESVGGGVCQVATTLYNAVIRAELEISMRFNHSMMVSYVPPSDDAAIAGTYKDFRFKNNKNTPIYVEGYCNGGIITFKVYGVEDRPANRVVSFESETVSQKDPEVQFNVTGDNDLGYIATTQGAHQGVVARLWKIVTVDGVQESKEVFNNSTYNASPKIVTVGIRGASEAQAAAIRAAAASGDESAVQSAVAAAKAELQKQEQEKAEAEAKAEEEKQQQQQEKPAVQEEKPQPQQKPVQEETDVNSDDLVEEDEE